MQNLWPRLAQAYLWWMKCGRALLRHPRTPSLAKFKAAFWAKEEHQWLRQDKALHRGFNYLWDIFPLALRAQLPRDLCFVRCAGRLACSVAAQKKRGVILIFPELERLLHSASPEQALAIICHELAHLILGHHQHPVDAWDAQLAADRLVAVMGLGRELQEVIADYAPAWQAQARIAELEKHLPPPRPTAVVAFAARHLATTNPPPGPRV